MIILAEIKSIKEFADNDHILYDEAMSRHTTFKIGGCADAVALPESEEELIMLIKAARANKIPYCIIGNGSNLLVSDKGIRGLVIKLFKNFSDISVDGDTITAQSGALLSKVSSVAMQNSLTGMEFASGIPGTIGGAVFMNAGAYGGEMKDITVETRYLDENLEIKTVTEHGFGYRKSIFADTNKIILSGHSMGGIGVYDLANGKSDLFSAFVVMSGYNTKTDLTQYNKIPIKGYVGLPETGEDNSSYKHMINSFVKNFGQENLTIFETTHGKIPKTAFTQDLNNDNRSDLIEWMLNQ